MMLCSEFEFSLRLKRHGTQTVTFTDFSDSAQRPGRKQKGPPLLQVADYHMFCLPCTLMLYSHQDVPSVTSSWTACRAMSTLSITCFACAALSAAGSCLSTMDRLRRDTLFLLYRGGSKFISYRICYSP